MSLSKAVCMNSTTVKGSHQWNMPAQYAQVCSLSSPIERTLRPQGFLRRKKPLKVRGGLSGVAVFTQEPSGWGGYCASEHLQELKCGQIGTWQELCQSAGHSSLGHSLMFTELFLCQILYQKSVRNGSWSFSLPLRYTHWRKRQWTAPSRILWSLGEERGKLVPGV